MRPVWLCLSMSLATAPALAALVKNKTIVLQWTSVGTGTRADGTTVNFTNTNIRTIYISSTGRLFARRQFQSQNSRVLGSQTNELAPGDKQGVEGARDLSFSGNTLIGRGEMLSGALQFVATFDPSFTSCTVQVTFGRSGSAAIRTRGPDGAPYTLQNIRAMSPSCQISDGNPF